jgi:hypothetical protein
LWNQQTLRVTGYESLSAFVSDLNLIVDNCLEYNGPSTKVSDTAVQFRDYWMVRF